VQAHCAPAPLPVGETGGSKRQGDRSGGGSPALKGPLVERVCTSACQFSKGLDGRKRGRPGRPLGSAPASAGALPWRARGAEPHSSSIKRREAYQRTRVRSHSRVARPVKRAAAGASASRRRRRDAGPTAPGERLKSDFTTRWYRFCICDIVSMLCMSILGVCMITEPVFKRGRHGQESEEGKEDRESRQEGCKEDVKKEVVVSATERVRLRIKTGRKANL